MELLNKVLEILATLDSSAAIATAAVVVEFILRLVPSTKPLSILHVIADGIRVVGQIATKAADLLDKVLPQRLKAE